MHNYEAPPRRGGEEHVRAPNALVPAANQPCGRRGLASSLDASLVPRLASGCSAVKPQMICGGLAWDGSMTCRLSDSPLVWQEGALSV